MKQYLFGVTIIICILLIIVNNFGEAKAPPRPIEIVIEVDITPTFLTQDTVTLELLKEALLYYNVKHPDIVLAQAILETGHFKSKICKNYNNLFGLYHYRKKDFYKFDHWSDSIAGYLKYIQYKYNPVDDYYEFLDNLGYAEDPLYITKLKRIGK